MKLVKNVSLFNAITATRSNTSYGVPNYSPPWLYTAGNYDGTVEVFLEVYMSVSGGTGYAALYTTGGSVVTGSELTTTSGTKTRFRSGDIKANLSDATSYQIRLKTTSGVTVTLYSARLIIIQTGTITKTETVIDLGSRTTSTSTSYAEDTSKGYWKYDAAYWDGATFYFESYLSPSSAALTAYNELQATGGGSLSGSEVTQTGSTTDTVVRSGAITPVDGTIYRVHHKISASGTVRTTGARIIVVQTSFNKTVSYFPMGHVNTFSAEADTDKPVYWDDDEWSVYTLTKYFEATITAPASQTSYVDCNDGTNDDVTVSHNTSSKTLVRSSSWVPDDNTEYHAQTRTSSGTGTLCQINILAVAVLVSPNVTPTIALNTADETTLGVLPTLEFTGSDDDDDDLRYQIQISNDPNFASGSTLQDNYFSGGGANMHPNPDGLTTWLGDNGVDDRPGMSWTAIGGILDKIAVRFQPDVDTDGIARIRVYAHQGTYGTSSAPLNKADPEDTPTPGWLAVSDDFPFDTSGILDWHEFAFSGANRIQLESGVHYVYVLDWIPSDTLYDNTIETYHDSTVLGHGGNVYVDGSAPANNGPWPTLDMFFRIYEDMTLLDKTSGTDSGFANTVSGGDTDPFNAGEKIGFTVQSGDDLVVGIVYYWRVRVKDPSGTDTWSDWSTARSFTVVEGGTTYYQDVGGTLNLSGILVKSVSKNVVGSLPLSGSLVKNISKTLSGSLPMSGTLIKSVSKTVSGALSMSGTVVKTAIKMLYGTLSSSGTLIKSVSKTLSGTLGSSGTLKKDISKTLSGTLGLSGDLSMTKVVLLLLTGVVSFSGSLSKQANVTMSGALSMSGSLVKNISKTVSGVLSMSGTLVKNVGKTLSGAVNFSGTLSTTKVVLLLLSGVVNFSGTVVKRVNKTLVGTLPLSGAVTKQVNKTLSGVVTFSGSVYKYISKYISGVVIFVGNVISIVIPSGPITYVRERIFNGLFKGIFRRGR